MYQLSTFFFFPSDNSNYSLWLQPHIIDQTIFTSLKKLSVGLSVETDVGRRCLILLGRTDDSKSLRASPPETTPRFAE